MSGGFQPPKVSAELCGNHQGDFEIAKRMVRMCDICGVQVVKLQKRDIASQAAMHPVMYKSPHPNPTNAFGATYYEHREKLEFSLEQHAELKKYIEDHNMVYSTSVWDLESAKQIITLEPRLIKIPSACNMDTELAIYLRDNYDGDVHISLGMTTIDEYRNIKNFWVNDWDRVVLYHCTSEYPLQPEDAYLLEIENLYSLSLAKEIGFSNHHCGISLDMAAQALGASWFEHHVSLDRTWKGTDHAAALDFSGLRDLVRGLQDGYLALQYRGSDFAPRELEQREKLKLWK